MFVTIFFCFFTVGFLIIFYYYCYYYFKPKNKKFPKGPFGLPVLGYAPFLQLPFEKKLAKLSKKFGSIYSIVLGSLRVVVISDGALWREITKDERFTDRPLVKAFIDRNWGKPRGIVFNNGKDQMEQRRFTIKVLRDLGYGRGSMESLIKDEVVETIEQLRNTLRKPISLESCFDIAVLNTLWHLIAGERYAYDDPRLLEIIESINEITRASEISGPIILFDWLTRLFPVWSGYKKYLAGFFSQLDMLKEVLDSHKKSFDPNNPKDFIDYYLKEIESTTDQSSGFYGEEGVKSLLIVLLDLLGASIETTSTTLNWSILYLITFPEVQDKLYEEILEVIGSDRLSALTDRPRLNYLEAFIAETLRMSSILRISAHCPVVDTEFHGYSLPKGTIMDGNIWQMHFDPKIWSNPNSFKPERFLSKVDGKFVKNENLIPFGLGKRSCLGENLARDELFLFLSGLLQTFSFSSDPSSPPPSLEGISGLVAKPKPFKVIISLRT